MEKFPTFEKKICDEWAPGDLVRISNYRPDDDSSFTSYGFVVVGHSDKKQIEMFPVIKIYDIIRRKIIDTYSYNLEIISSKE
jgi:hypothetical protein